MTTAAVTDLTDAPSRRGVLRETGRFARPHRMLLTVAVLTGVLASLLTTIVPVLVGRLTDALLTGDRRGALVLAWIGVGAAVVQVVAAGAGRAWLARAGEYLVRDVRDRVVDRLSTVALRFVERHRAGELLQRSTAEIAALSAFVRESLTEVVVTTATVLLLVVVLSVQSWQLALVLLITFLPVSLFILWRFRRRASAAFGAEAAAEADVQASFAETVRVRELLAGASPTGRRSFRAAYDRLNGAAVAAQLRTVVLGRWISAMSLVEGLSLAALVVVGGRLAADGTVSVGVVVSFVLGGLQLFSRFSDLVALVGAVEEAATGAARTSELLRAIDTPSPPVSGTGAGTGSPAAVELVDVGFGYGAEPVLAHLSYRFVAGRRYGIAGRTGVGKSTLVKLIAGLYLPDRGTVRLGGVSTAGLAAAQRVRAVAFVPQLVTLGTGTLADELRLVDPGASDDRLRQAAARTGLARWLDALPGGVDAAVDSFSAGERQLVGLIRVALLDARVLLLDEATSDIDPVTAALVEQALEALAQGRTIIVVAHRAATLERLDEVLELDADGLRCRPGTHGPVRR